MQSNSRSSFKLGFVHWLRKNRAEALYGIQVDTCARVQSLAQGDQILLTRFAFDEARRSLSFDELNGVDPLTWLNHGPYLLKGVPCSSLAFVQPTSAPDKMERELKRRAG